MASVPSKDDKDIFKNIETHFPSPHANNGKKKMNLLPKVLSVLAAISLWLYVFQAVEEERVFKEIPIVFENFNTGLDLDVVSGYEGTVDVTVTGTKSALNNLASSDIKAAVDLESVTERGSYVLDVNLEVPSSVKITDKSLTQLKIVVDKTVQKQLELKTSLKFTVQYPYELGELEISDTTVTVMGPETDINAVSEAVLPISLGSVKNSVDAAAEVVLYDVNGYEIRSKYIVVTPDKVNIHVPVYKTAFFGVQPDIVYDKERFDYTFTPSAVYLKGTVNDIESVATLKTKRILIDAAGEYELPLVLPDSVKAYSTYNADDNALVSSVRLTVTEKPIEDEQTDTSEEETNE